MIEMPRAMNTEYDFWKRVVVDDGCWERPGARRNHGGYGEFSFNGQKWLSHRFAWTAWNGPIPDRLWVLHHCDNKRCVRPDHLYLGTVIENARDAVERQRTKRYSKTHCANGHEFIPENIKVRPNGERFCAICKREHNRISIAKKRARARAAN